jgi:hypothetical protein
MLPDLGSTQPLTQMSSNVWAFFLELKFKKTALGIENMKHSLMQTKLQSDVFVNSPPYCINVYIAYFKYIKL